MSPDAQPAKPAKPCPICRKPAAKEFRPFCSRGCRDRDLLNWFGDGYAVPGEAVTRTGRDEDDEAGV